MSLGWDGQIASMVRWFFASYQGIKFVRPHPCLSGGSFLFIAWAQHFPKPNSLNSFRDQEYAADFSCGKYKGQRRPTVFHSICAGTLETELSSVP